MSAWRRYLTGLALVLGAGTALILLLPATVRAPASLGAGIALLVQAPLGWWVVRSIGTSRFQLVWTAGIGIRFAAVGLTGLLLVPAAGWDATAVLGSMVTALLMLLAAEVVTAMREHS
jgi:hypothetical protein